MPLLPSISLVANSYAHCQAEVSMAAVQAIASALDTLKESAGSTMGQLVEATHVDRLWNAVQSHIAAHFIDHYQERVKERCGGGSSTPIAAEKADTAQPDTAGMKVA